MPDKKNIYKKIPSHMEYIKDFRSNICVISNELENILESDLSIQKDLLIKLLGKIDEIIKILEANQDDEGFICKFYSDIFREIVLIASNSDTAIEKNKIESIVELLNFTKDEISKTINKANMLDDKSFA